jgi:hypothetical protein
MWNKHFRHLTAVEEGKKNVGDQAPNAWTQAKEV